jgi:hypothetical protein
VRGFKKYFFCTFDNLFHQLATTLDELTTAIVELQNVLYVVAKIEPSTHWTTM